VFEVGAGEPPALFSGGSGMGLQVGKPSALRGIHGSTRQVVDPLETMVKNAYALIHASEKAAINLAVANYASLPNMGKWVRVVNTPKEEVRTDLVRIRRALADVSTLGFNAAEKAHLQEALKHLGELPDELLLAFWRARTVDPAGRMQNIIRVVRNGKAEFYQLDKDLFETFNALNVDDVGKLMRAASAPAQWLRAGVVLEPGFAVANLFKDAFSAATISKHGLFPFEAMLKGFGAMINNPQMVAEWAASGGELAVEASFYDRSKLQKFVTTRVTKDLTAKERALIWTLSPIAAAKFVVAASENATRIGEFKTIYEDMIAKGVPPGEARRLAAFESRDRQDFAKGGAKTKLLRHLTPFWNAGLQGNVAFAQRLFNPKTRNRVLLQGFTYITIAKLIEQSINWDDEDYWARPQWERDAFFLIPIGKSASGHTRFLRLPNIHLPGLLFATIPGRIIQFAKKKDPNSVKDIPKLIFDQVSLSSTPAALTLLFELSAGERGWDFWRDRNIIPERLTNLPAPEQYTEQTTSTAKLIAKGLASVPVVGPEISPMKIDHAIAKSFGGIGQVTTGQKYPGQRFVAAPLEVSNQATDDFYKFLDKEQKVHGLAKRKDDEAEPHDRLKVLNEFDRTINSLRKQAREANTPERKLDIQKRLYDTTKRATDWYRKQK
jgi:hypothetical protein